MAGGPLRCRHHRRPDSPDSPACAGRGAARTAGAGHRPQIRNSSATGYAHDRVAGQGGRRALGDSRRADASACAASGCTRPRSPRSDLAASGYYFLATDTPARSCAGSRAKPGAPVRIIRASRRPYRGARRVAARLPATAQCGGERVRYLIGAGRSQTSAGRESRVQASAATRSSCSAWKRSLRGASPGVDPERLHCFRDRRPARG